MMNKIEIILDTLPRHFGHNSDDWASLFISRLLARPLVEKINGQYQMRCMDAVEKIRPKTWQLRFGDVPDDFAHKLLDEWRCSAASGHGQAFYFLRQAKVIDANIIEIEGKQDYNTILPFLDSPWLWFGMRAVSHLSPTWEKSSGANRAVLSSFMNSSSLRIEMVHSQKEPEETFKYGIVAGVPQGSGERSFSKATNIEFAIVPNRSTRAVGPFIVPGVIDEVRGRSVTDGFLGTSEYSKASKIKKYALAGKKSMVDELAYTPFYPNSHIADLVGKNIRILTGYQLKLSEVTYPERYRDYSQSKDGANLVPIVPVNSACTSVPRTLLKAVQRYLSDDILQYLFSELDDIDLDLISASSVRRVSEIMDIIAATTGFGTIGRYIGIYRFDNMPHLVISDAGYVDFK
jgi:hypothetical protein